MKKTKKNRKKKQAKPKKQSIIIPSSEEEQQEEEKSDDIINVSSEETQKYFDSSFQQKLESQETQNISLKKNKRKVQETSDHQIIQEIRQMYKCYFFNQNIQEEVIQETKSILFSEIKALIRYIINQNIQIKGSVTTLSTQNFLLPQKNFKQKYLNKIIRSITFSGLMKTHGKQINDNNN